MEKLTGKYEKKEREYFESKYPCLYLLGTPIEDEEIEDDDDYLMRCFAKEYPDMSFELFEKQFLRFGESGIVSQIEDKYNCTLDMDGSDNMYGFMAADNISLKDLNECFEEIVREFENTKEN